MTAEHERRTMNSIGQRQTRRLSTSSCWSGAGSGSPSIDADHLVDARIDAAVEIALLEQRHDGVVDDAARGRIGAARLRGRTAPRCACARSSLATISTAPSSTPLRPSFQASREPHAELRDVFGLGRRQDQHRDLRALARLERGELVFERGLLRGGERAGEIGDARFEPRQRNLRVRRRRDGRRAARATQ